MRELLDDLRSWRSAGTRFALATVVSTWSSAPRPAGAAMAVAEDGRVIGSVSGGCVEASVHALALDVLATGRPVLQRFGVSTEDAFAVGLTCGGELEVYVEPADDFAELDRVLDAIDAGRPIEVTTVLGGPEHELTEDALSSETARLVSLADGRAAFVQGFAPPPRMIVFGAIDFAAAVVSIGRFLGYRVTLCDARPVFATAARFPDAHEIVVDWPHRYLAGQQVDVSTALCVLTHDPKFDVPLLEVALETPAEFIGVMGSRRTQADRVRRLRERGVGEMALARLRAPVGLDLGAQTPAETAVSIAAELVALRHGRSGLPLRDLEVSIHAESVLACGG